MRSVPARVTTPPTRRSSAADDPHEPERALRQRADQLAESRIEEADAIAKDATTTEQQAAAEKQRLQREAAAADKQAAQLRAQTDK